MLQRLARSLLSKKDPGSIMCLSGFPLGSPVSSHSESDKVLKSYRIKGFINVWLNVACILKHNETI